MNKQLKVSKLMQTAVNFLNQAKLSPARNACKKALKLAPNNFNLIHLSGVIELNDERLDAAERLFKQAIKINYNNADVHNNLAMTYKKKGMLTQAEQQALEAVRLSAGKEALFYANLAYIYTDTEQFDKALAAHQQAKVIAPYNAQHLYDIGWLLRRMKQYEQAINYLQQALAINPKDLNIYYELALAFEQIPGSDNKAEDFLLQAIKLEKNNVRTLYNLASFYEKQNKLDQAEKVINDALYLAPDELLLNITAATIARRRGDFVEAENRLLAFIKQAKNKEGENELYYELGRISDRLNKCDVAFKYFTKANSVVRNSQYNNYHLPYFNRVERLSKCFTPQWLNEWQSNSNEQKKDAPVFLVGFPRSGTTLLDQILDAHTKIDVLEEKPTIDVLDEYLVEKYEDYPDRIAQLSSAEIDSLRGMYYEQINKYHTHEQKTLFIDKMPLNIVHIALINRLFPNAKYIVALRHPCDVILSCFMQNFAINSAMANFLSLDTSVKFYITVMRLWLEYKKLLELNFLEIKYEDVVMDKEVQTRKILEFLGVSIEDCSQNHVQHAKSRKINTPSYEQVSQPIYTHAKYRWLRYKEQFEPYMNELEPFIKSFSYEQ